MKAFWVSSIYLLTAVGFETRFVLGANVGSFVIKGLVRESSINILNLIDALMMGTYNSQIQCRTKSGSICRWESTIFAWLWSGVWGCDFCWHLFFIDCFDVEAFKINQIFSSIQEPSNHQWSIILTNVVFSVGFLDGNFDGCVVVGKPVTSAGVGLCCKECRIMQNKIVDHEKLQHSFPHGAHQCWIVCRSPAWKTG